MSPPPKQLIQDYLGRLSAAARGRLSAEDRQALVAHTRDFIERNASPSGPATAMEVATLLSRLGDPAALVAREAARIAGGGDEGTELPTTRGKRRGLLRRRSGPASWHWPQLPGSPEMQVRLLNGVRHHAEAHAAGEPGPVSASTGAAGANGTDPEPLPAPAESPIWVPRQASSPEEGVQPAPEPGPAGPNGRPMRPSTVATSPDGTAPEPGQDAQAATEPLSRRVVRVSAPLVASAVRLARGNPVEALAVVLLGLGGAAYPPVWLLGALFALASRAWDYRDKWIGLAGPVLLLIVGTIVGVSLGGSHSSMGSFIHQGWVYADVLSRVAAVLGTAYLVWRLRHGRREPPMPPWTKPHKVG